jgi:hypothetical protein
MMDSANPLAGWSYPDILSIPTGPMVNDLYGKLHTYVQERLAIFQKRLCSQPFVLVFTSIDAKDLPKCCKAHFSRIEVSYGP